MTNTPIPAIRISISSGPSREELFDALRLRHEHRPILVKVHPLDQKPMDIKFIVNGIAVEDGGGQNWLIELLNVQTHQIVRGYYNSRTRAGWLDFPRV
ncbi:MAG: hypothetical protein NTZ36_00725 [Candidatus Jorgensenbacteria bacterium]|nr:hypothetical protein [Candidatus Jorgensenbacteria bacterium]